MTLPTYNASGQKQTAYEVADEIFNLNKINHNLLKLAYEYYLAKRRINLAVTKTRGLVRGGGRKIRPQKHTGSARAGSNRSPLWRSGGVIFGPTGLETYDKKINKKVKNLAIKHALSLKKDHILTLTKLPDDGHTATIAKLLFKNLKLDKKVLIIDDDLSESVQLAVRNLQDVHLIKVDYLNVFRILNADWLIFTIEALEKLQERFTNLAIQTAQR